MSTYSELIDRAAAIIAEHNGAIGEGGKQIDFEAFKTGLARMGGTTEEALKLVSWEDLQALSLPTLIAKRVAVIFRQEGDGSAARTARRITPMNRTEVTVDELVAAFDPRQPSNLAAQEMKVRSGDRPCVVFDRDGGVHRKLTAQCLQELVAGDPPRLTIEVGGKPSKVYKVGELPDETVDEHPLRRGTQLRRDGTDDLGIHWTGLKLDVRQLLHIAVHETGELRVNGNDGVHDVFERASKDGAMSALRTRYPQASIRFDELETAGNLPTLKIAKSGAQSGGRPNNPFGGSGNRVV